MRADLHERITEDPWGLVEEALEHSVRNEAMPEDLEDAVVEASALLVCGALYRRGIPIGYIDQMLDRDFAVNLKYDIATEEFGVTLEFDNGEVAATKKEYDDKREPG